MKRTNNLSPAQKWERATLADNFIFCKIMTANPDLCKELLELLLGIKIDRIEQPLAEHSLKTDYGSKGVRFDVYVKDGTGRCFDIEVQTTNRKNLARRARYYQSLMDVDSLERGTDYSDLKDCYVIFLCLDDPFGYGLPVYTFENLCKEDKEIFLDDGAHKIFYNAAKHAIMPGETLKSFFRFLSGMADDGTAFSGRLAALVSHAKTNGQWRQQFMTWEQEMKEQVKERSEELAHEIAHELALELAEEIAEERAHELAEEIAEERAQELAEERAEELAQARVQELADEAYQNGCEKTRAEMAVETARNFLTMGLSPEKVAQGTGLPLKRVERLQREASALKA